MSKILDYIFGEKVKVVTATRLWGHDKYEQKFLFHKDEPEESIKKLLWWQKEYSIEKIETLRSNNIITPRKNHCIPLTKERCVQSYD